MTDTVPTVEEALKHCFGGEVIERVDGEIRIRYSSHPDPNYPDAFVVEYAFTELELRRHLEILFRAAVDSHRQNPHLYALREMSLDSMESLSGDKGAVDMPMRLIPGIGFLTETDVRQAREDGRDLRSEWLSEWGETASDWGPDVMPTAEEALRHCFGGSQGNDEELRITYPGEVDERIPDDFAPEYLLTRDEMRRHIDFLAGIAKAKRKPNPRAYVLDRMLQNSREVLRSSSKADMPVRLIPDEGFVTSGELARRTQHH